MWVAVGGGWAEQLGGTAVAAGPCASERRRWSAYEGRERGLRLRLCEAQLQQKEEGPDVLREVTICDLRALRALK